jgi:hypothetical protein
MPKENIAAGTSVPPGIYQCNACANEFECTEEGEKVPQCCVCDSISWRTYRLKNKSGEKPAGRK